MIILHNPTVTVNINGRLTMGTRINNGEREFLISSIKAAKMGCKEIKASCHYHFIT